jgi:hypothetical protein
LLKENIYRRADVRPELIALLFVGLTPEEIGILSPEKPICDISRHAVDIQVLTRAQDALVFELERLPRYEARDPDPLRRASLEFIIKTSNEPPPKVVLQAFIEALVELDLDVSALVPDCEPAD